jgi:pilus assembly protein CpaE
MDNRIIPVTLALDDKDERKRLERIVAASYMVRLADEDADETGVLIYEPGETVDEDLAHIIHALETGRLDDVYLAGRNADPDILIRAMRSGIREFLQYPVEESDFRAALMRTAMRLSKHVDDGTRGRIVTLAGSKAGQGVSTLAASLAWSLNRRAPGRTLLLDLRRPAGEIPYFLDLKYEYTWGHLMEDISRLDATYLHSVVTEHESGLNVLPGPVSGDRPDGGALSLILEQLRFVYDFIVVDTAWWPGDDALSGAVPSEIEKADSLFVPLHLTLPSLFRASRLVEAVRRQAPDAERNVRLVANRVIKDSTIGVAEAADVLGREIAWVVPEDFSSALSALNQGAPLTASYPKSPASRVIERMAAELDHRQATAGKRFSLSLGSLFGRRKGAAANLAGAAS